jgi:ABC-2 type transport system ATP-binding protein
LILDEPLAYLDIISQQVVLRQLKQLARNRARPIAVIITSQQLYEIEAIADRMLVLDGGNILFSDEVAKLSKLIDDLVVEFASTASMKELKARLSTLPHYRSLIATETGFISVFKRDASVENGDRHPSINFNEIVRFLGQECPGDLSYARDISNSCRILFEPRMKEWLSSDRR